ncbi:unnamed protein product [Clonostachys byssicola]|uniref:NmrA-like domain-containing protein n=1 Tax=Clonostachys byssicola TaxID=160290 RepID=A0A9N9UF25_9HYPO|nr:unnamed protein product [Clonostachys byssicola]
MSPKIRVAVAGASGVTGSSVMNALLATPETFEVTALARPPSLGKQVFVEYSQQGVIVKSVELDGPAGVVAQNLAGIDVVISCLTLRQMKEEMTLVTAAHEAGVSRYVPSFFGPVCPPRGVMLAREMKENILDHVKRLYLPYTIIDVGWWYQLSLPRLPSGKVRVKEEYSTTQIIGDGTNPWSFVDNRDIGKYVARIIADPKTLNKQVFCYSEMWTQNDVYESWGALTGESITRNPITKEELLQIISEGEAEMAHGDLESAAMLKLGMAQYKYLLGIRGDNTPEHAKYLGYLDAKELYPDIVASSFKNYMNDLFTGNIKAPYI